MRRWSIGDIREDLGKTCADALRAVRRTAEFVPLDVTSEASWERAIPEVISCLGGLDILVNNAGVEITSLLVDLDADDVRRMLEVNVLGTALGIKHGFRAMRPGGPAGQGGAIVNVASVAATIAFPGIAVYSATKSAVDRLTRVAAMEVGQARLRGTGQLRLPGPGADRDGRPAGPGRGRPGPVREPEAAVGAVVELTPLGRLGEVADMADAVVFLASDGARFITGAGLPVDGGMGM